MTHPYVQYTETPLWRTVEKAIRGLEKNGDVEMTTVPDYVIGYLCKVLAEGELVTPKALATRRPRVKKRVPPV